MPRAEEEEPLLHDASGDGHLTACHLVGEGGEAPRLDEVVS